MAIAWTLDILAWFYYQLSTTSSRNNRCILQVAPPSNFVSIPSIFGPLMRKIRKKSSALCFTLMHILSCFLKSPKTTYLPVIRMNFPKHPRSSNANLTSIMSRLQSKDKSQPTGWNYELSRNSSRRFFCETSHNTLRHEPKVYEAWKISSENTNKDKKSMMS